MTPTSRRRRWLPWLAGAILLLLLAGAALAWAVVAYFERDLPSVASLRELKLSVPLRVYTRDGRLMGEFGAERRALLAIDKVPERVIQAFLAAEDDRFFDHPGVDWMGLARAAFKLAASGERHQGGSTITMQLARNVYLTSERTYTRKFREILLALNIERTMTKREILELYLNKIFLGERAYGVGAAALVYFGKDVEQLTLSELALIAGLPKAPSRDNPVASPQRARDRRDYVLRRMRELNYVSELEYEAARAEPVAVHPYRAKVEVDAQYVAEMVRAELYAQFGEDAYSRGFMVTTTLDPARQQAADGALRQALHEYDERHGWRGPETRLPPDLLAASGTGSLAAALAALPTAGALVPAVVLEYSPQKLRVLAGADLVELPPEAFRWAGFTEKKKPAPGDVVRLARAGEAWRLAQIPAVAGAFVAIDPRDGAIEALAGGYDFYLSRFNHATQARRQAGSGFKPFLYASGLAFGFTPASVILDAPVVFDDPNLESAWRPENYGGDFKGPMRLREALVQSRNLVSIRLLQAVGIDYARDYIRRFGLPVERLPPDLTMALGSAVFTPLEMARGYAAIANGGFMIEPHFIREVRDASGAVVFQAAPRRACPDCAQARVAAAGEPPPEVAPPPLPDDVAPRTLEPPIIWLLTDMMHDVTVRGTAAKVNELGRNDLAGKTGTTNDETDAWFNGFQKDLVGVAWVGFDQPTPLGRGEVGGRAALPMWIDFMRAALKGVEQATLPRPPGLVHVRINPGNGKLASAGDPEALFETVQQDRIPEPDDGLDHGQEPGTAVEDLF